MTTPRKRPAAKKAAPPAKDSTNRFIESIKRTTQPVTAVDQLTAQAAASEQARRSRFSSKGTTAEFDALMTKLKRKVAQKGIRSMDDI